MEVDEILRAVELTGTEIAIPIISRPGWLEHLFTDMRRRGLRVAAVPPGCVTVLPPLPADEETLLLLCRVYEAYMRRELNVPAILLTIFSEVLLSRSQADVVASARGALVLSEFALRIASLVYSLLRVSAVEFLDTSRYVALLHISEIIHICERMRFECRTGASDVSDSGSSASDLLNGALQRLQAQQTQPFLNLDYFPPGQGGEVPHQDATDLTTTAADGAMTPLRSDNDDPEDAGEDQFHDWDEYYGMPAPSQRPPVTSSASVVQPQRTTTANEEDRDDESETEAHENDPPVSGKAEIPRPPPTWPSEAEFELVTASGLFFENPESKTPKIAAVYLRGKLPLSLCSSAAAVLEDAATQSNLRQLLNGGVTAPETGIVGFYDYLNNPTERKCRETQFTRKYWPMVSDAVAPMLQALDELYRTHAPVHHRLQKSALPRSYQLFDTAFSTVTVNRNFRTAYHTDRSDFRSGLGVLAVVDGMFEGCHLAIPKLKKAFRMKTGDVLLFDTSLLHGNTEVHSVDGMWHRTSVVCYFRTGLASQRCLQAERSRLDRLLYRGLGSHGADVVNINGADPSRPPLFVPTRIRDRFSDAQTTALSFANDRLSVDCGCIIALSMGLGKTLLSLCLCFNTFHQYPTDDILIVTPKTVLPHWTQELRKWSQVAGMRFFPRFITAEWKEIDFESGLARYNQQREGNAIRAGHCIIVNPEIVASVLRRLPSFDPVLVILDEGHRVSSKQSKLKETLSALRTRKRVVLSGTPIQNETEELYRLVEWTQPEVSRTLPRETFLQHATAVEAFITSGEKSTFAAAVQAQQYIMQWQQGYVCRFTDHTLPPIEDLLVVCGSSGYQVNQRNHHQLGSTAFSGLKASEHRTFHLSAHPLCLIGFVAGLWGREITDTHQGDSPSPLNAVTHLVRDSDVSYCEASCEELHRDSLEDTAVAFDTLLRQSGKMTVLIGIARHCMSMGERLVIFSQYVGVQETIQKFLSAAGISNLAIRGRDGVDARKMALQQFTNGAEGADVVALVVSTKAGAFGVDLTAANHVVLFDSWWNPQVDAQAIARCYRRNQTKPVTVYRLATFWEDRCIIRAQMRKLALFKSVVDGTMAFTESTNMDDLLSAPTSEDDAQTFQCSDTNAHRSASLWAPLSAVLLEGDADAEKDGERAVLGVHRYTELVNVDSV